MAQLSLLSGKSVRVMLNDGGCTPEIELIVGAVDEFMLVGVVLNRALTVLVVNWKSMHSVVGMLVCMTAGVTVIARVKMVLILVSIMVCIVVHVLIWIISVVWLVAGQGMMPVPVG